SEAMIAAAPDVLLVMSDGLKSVGGIDGLVKVPGIAQTPAGRNRRVIDMSDAVLLSFGPNTGRVITALSDAVYGKPA
ncbi:ABC transporter substrate-binding protein, partial [Nocardia cyriacigeorgica]|nr:ABC transporter substrate-binding protein [Nocardia cyriacigeorgica]